MSLRIPILLISLTVAVLCIDVTYAKETKELSVKKYKKMCDDQTAIKKPLKCYSDFLWRRLDRFKVWKKRKRMFKYRDLKKMRVKRRAVEGSSVDLLAGKVSDGGVNPLSVVGRFKLRWPVAQWRQYGLFTDEYLLLINTHWLTFAPPHPAVNYALGGLYIVLFLIGCCGNLLVLLMYFRCRTLRTPGNILVANLALSDFLMLAKTPIFIFNSFNLGPALGKTGCVIYGFVGGMTGTTSIATLSAIALDRYWAVVRPLEPLRALTAIRARVLAAASWLYAAFFALIPALDIGYGRYVPEGYLTSCSFDYLTEELPPRYFIFVFFCAAWVLPLCTISYCYLNILHVVAGTRNVTTNKKEHLSSRHIKEQAKKKAEIKLAVLVIAVIVLFFVSWTPYAVVALLGIFGKKDLISPLASMIPALFCKTAACINPFIYIITHPKFRKEFKKLLFTDKSKRMGGTTKSKGYTVASTKGRRISKELSESDEVEVLAMEDIPFQTESLMAKPGMIKSISSKICAREGSQRSMSMKSFEESAVTPPSWYTKPQFTKRKSLRLSLKSNS